MALPVEFERLSAVAFTESNEVGERFSGWPDHLPLLPQMVTTVEIGKRMLSQVAKNTYSVDIDVKSEGRALATGQRARLLGSKRSVEVARMLHSKLLAEAHAYKGKKPPVRLEESSYVGSNYKPYIFTETDP